MIGGDVGAEGVSVGRLGAREGGHVEGEEEFEFGGVGKRAWAAVNASATRLG